jgi:hypothetical protein
MINGFYGLTIAIVNLISNSYFWILTDRELDYGTPINSIDAPFYS